MKRYLAITLALSLGATLAACSKGEKSRSEPASAESGGASGESQHAPADVEPGSHADWCGEHAVPESQCTRCNPDLIAAFKATGDWCEEHGLPESQCLECNPDLEIVRPPPEDPAEAEE